MFLQRSVRLNRLADDRPYSMMQGQGLDEPVEHRGQGDGGREGVEKYMLARSIEKEKSAKMLSSVTSASLKFNWLMALACSRVASVW